MRTVRSHLDRLGDFVVGTSLVAMYFVQEQAAAKMAKPSFDGAHPGRGLYSGPLRIRQGRRLQARAVGPAVKILDDLFMAWAMRGWRFRLLR